MAEWNPCVQVVMLMDAYKSLEWILTRRKTESFSLYMLLHVLAIYWVYSKASARGLSRQKRMVGDDDYRIVSPNSALIECYIRLLLTTLGSYSASEHATFGTCSQISSRSNICTLCNSAFKEQTISHMHVASGLSMPLICISSARARLWICVKPTALEESRIRCV